MKFFKFVIAIAIVTVLFVKCDKDDDKNNNSSVDKIIVVDASSHTDWKYFSFEKGDTVSITDTLNSLNWDIAFKRSAIKTNGGLSGKGQAGAFNTKLTNENGYNALTIVPDTAKFVSDDTVVNYGPNGEQTKAVLNEVLNNWYSYNPSNPGNLPSANNIYIVKTASGKYVKFWIKSYYRDSDAKSGFFKFQYFYQADASKNLK